MKFKINPILQFAIAFVLVLLVGVGYTYAQDDAMKKADTQAPTKQVIKAAAQSGKRSERQDSATAGEVRPARRARMFGGCE